MLFRSAAPNAVPNAAQSSAPNTAPTFCIIAVQLLPGTARLVHVRAAAGGSDAATIESITEASAEDLWSEPRWSHDGNRIAVTHWQRGGISEIAILDRKGAVVRALGRSRAVNGSPAWGPGDSTIFFTSDRNGRSAVYQIGRAHV